MKRTILSLQHMISLIDEPYFKINFHSVYIVTVWRLSTPDLSTLQSQGLLLAYSLLPWPDSRNNSRRLSLSVQGQAVPLPSLFKIVALLSPHPSHLISSLGIHQVSVDRPIGCS